MVADERYQRLAALRQDLADRIQTGRADRIYSAEEIVSMAQLKMKYATDMHAMEADALNAEPAVKDAQDRLVAAGSRIAALRERHDDARRNDPDLLDARRNVEDARIAKIAAEAYYNATAIAGDYALDAFYLGRSAAGRYSNYNYGGDYGYGYGGRY